MITKIGSQSREKLEESGYELVRFLNGNKETALLRFVENIGIAHPADEEVWVKRDDFAGYVIEIEGNGYEFVCNAKGYDIEGAK